MPIEVVLDAGPLREFADQAIRLVCDLRNPAQRARALKEIASTLATGAVLGGCLGGLFAIGQSLAIGFHVAWNLYGVWWLLAAIFGALLPVAMLALGLVYHALRYPLTVATRSLRPEKLRRVHGIAITTVAFVAMIVGTVWAGYELTRERFKALSSEESTDADALTKVVGEQLESVSVLSGSARDLLEQLNRTETEIQAAKKELETTLATFEHQREAAEKTARELKELEERRTEINLRIQELERILQGKAPVTRDDLRQASNSGLLVGVIVGFLTSLAASFAFRYMMRARQERARLG